MIRRTRDRRLIDWLCREAGGTFAPDVPAAAPAAVVLVPAQNEEVKEAAGLLMDIATSAQDGSIAPAEAEIISAQALDKVGDGGFCGAVRAWNLTDHGPCSGAGLVAGHERTGQDGGLVAYG